MRHLYEDHYPSSFPAEEEEANPGRKLLLERALGSGDQRAFAELVHDNLPLVHAVALRVSRDPNLAEEATQLVFIRLASLRRTLPDSVDLRTWLHRVTRSVAIDLVRAESRRRRRESVAAESLCPTRNDPATMAWERISPVIDEVISCLPAADRELILSRFFGGCTHAAMAATLDLSEDAIRMRLKRAVDKMRGMLQRRGIVTTASLLALSLPSHAATPVPAGLQAAVLRAIALQPPIAAGWLPVLLKPRTPALLLRIAAVLALSSVIAPTGNYDSPRPTDIGAATAAAQRKLQPALPAAAPQTLPFPEPGEGPGFPAPEDSGSSGATASRSYFLPRPPPLPLHEGPSPRFLSGRQLEVILELDAPDPGAQVV
jgi:RNA polymerase sigma factor (sigma-70 family)